MKSRLFLPMLLIVAVFLVTPVLFPGKPRVPPPRPTRDAAAPAAPGAVSPTAPGAQVPAVGQPAPTGAARASVRADTTVVTTPRASFRLSNVGAALVGVELRAYRSLADSAPV